MNAKTCKLYVEKTDIIKRFGLPSNVTHAALVAKLASKLPQGKQIKQLKYLDDENEWVVVGSAKEWTDSQAWQAKVLKLSVLLQPIKKGKETTNTTTTSSSSKKGKEKLEDKRVTQTETVTASKHHFNYVCDQCKGGNIIGDRYSCNICSDYDLCRTCFDKRTHDQLHTFTRHTFADKVNQLQQDMHNTKKLKERKLNQARQEALARQYKAQQEAKKALLARKQAKADKKKKPKHKYYVQLAKLRDMGFTDTVKNIKTLARFNGDIMKTVNHYVANE